MYGVLDLTWIPTTSRPEPKVGQAPAIVRGDTYTLVIPFLEDDGVTPKDMSDGTITAMVRSERLTGDPTEAALAEFSVSIAGVSDSEVTVQLQPATTRDLPSTATGFLYWDMQQDIAGEVTTWLAGKVKIADDVTEVFP